MDYRVDEHVRGLWCGQPGLWIVVRATRSMDCGAGNQVYGLWCGLGSCCFWIPWLACSILLSFLFLGYCEDRRGGLFFWGDFARFVLDTVEFFGGVVSM